MTEDDDPRRRSQRTANERLQLLEEDGQHHARLIGELVKAANSFSAQQLDQLRTVLREEFGDVGLRIDGPDHIDEAKEDFRWLRRTRLSWDNASKTTGRAVLYGVLAIIGTIGALGFWAWLSAHLGKS